MKELYIYYLANVKRLYTFLPIKRQCIFFLLALLSWGNLLAQRITQQLGRGVVVSTGSTQTLISWRKLAQEPENATYNIYVRSGEGAAWTKLNTEAVASTNYACSASAVPAGSQVSVALCAVDGEQMAAVPYTVKSQAWNNVVVDIDFETSVLTPNDYRAKYMWPADLDGDGEMEFVVDRLSTESFTTRSHKLQAYDRDGNCLWTVDMGPNVDICSGQNDMVTVGDMDLDGKAEVIIRASDGTRFWDATNNTWGKYACGSDVADIDGDGIEVYAEQSSRNPPYYCCLIDGMTGAEKAWVELDYSSANSGSDAWRRTNRSAYYNYEYGAMVGHFALAYFDGVHPSVVQECQTRTTDGAHHTYVFAFAYDFDTAGTATNFHQTVSTTGKGNVFHQLRVADMDGDGCDELVQGDYWLNPIKNTWATPGIAHGDRFRVSDIDPDRPGMEVYAIQQNALLGQILYDARTCEHIYEWYLESTGDVGRGECMDVDADHKGYEIYSTMANLYDCKGNVITTGDTSYPYEGVWWDGDLAREVLSSPGGSGWATNCMITKYDGTRLIQMSRESSWAVATATANRPLFFGDVLGDWREEVIVAKQNDSYSQGFVVYSTDISTDYSFYTLLQDPHYAGDITCRGYYQSPNTSFYLGYDMPLPPLPPVMKADVVYQNGAWTSSLADGKTLLFDLTGDNSTTIALDTEVKPDTVFFMPPRDFSYTISSNGSGALGGTADVWKSQQGTVTLNADITTTGTTYISEGMLRVNGTIAGPVDLRARGTLAGNATLKGTLTLEGALNYEGGRLMPGENDGEIGTMTIQNNLTIDKPMYLEIDIDENATQTADMLKVEGDITLSDVLTLTINAKNGTLQEGTYPLISYTGEWTGELTQIAVSGLLGLSYNVKDNEKTICLVVNGQREPAEGVVWSGAVSTTWDYQTQNFLLDNEATEFVSEDAIIFNDEATQTDVSVAELMPTTGVVVNNAEKDYSFTGNGGFSGTGGLTKDGAATLTLSTTKSDYTGPTVINEGKVVISTIANVGTASSLGAPESTSTEYLKIGNATLDVQSVSSVTDRGVTLTDSATICVASGSMNIQGLIAGSGSLTKTGAGQLTIGRAGANTWTGGTILRGGTLAQGAWNTTFGISGSPINVQASSSITVYNVNSTSTVPNLNNAITVADGATLTINPGQRCTLSGSLAGSGTVKLAFPYVRGDFAMTSTNFAGTLNPTSGQMRLTQALNMPHGTYTPASGVYTAGYASQSGSEQTYTHVIGALSGTDDDASFGTGIWNIGALGSDTEFAGTFGSAATLNKYGAGVLTLTGASTCVMNVREGTLQVNNTSEATTSGAINVYSGGTLAGRGHAATVNVYNGGTIRAGATTSSITGTITIEGTLTVASGGQLYVRARGAASMDRFSIGGTAVLTDPVFVIDRTSGDWTEGQEYKMFTGNGTVTITGEPTFEPAVPMPGYLWDYTRLASEGIITIVADPDGIYDIEADGQQNTVIYDASGRKMQATAAPGVYVVNGKKVVRK